MFCSENENGIPIHTDPKLKLKAINKGMLPTIFTFVINIVLELYILNMFLNWRFKDAVTSYFEITLVIFFISALITFMSSIIDYVVWLIKSVNLLKNGGNIKYNSEKNRRYKHRLRLFMILFGTIVISGFFTSLMIQDFNYYKLGFLLGLIAIILILFLVYKLYFKNKNHSRSSNILFTIVISVVAIYLFTGLITFTLISSLFSGSNAEVVTTSSSDDKTSITFTISHDEIPLSMKDLGFKVEGYNDCNADISKTFLAQNYEYSDDYFVDIDAKHTTISYSVFTSRYQCIIDMCLRSYLTSPFYASYEKIETSTWDANAVYLATFENNTKSIIVVSDNKLLKFESDIELKENDINLIREKLDLTN